MEQAVERDIESALRSEAEESEELIERVREALADRRPAIVSERTGIHPSTIARIRDGHSTPRGDTLLTLLGYLELA